MTIPETINLKEAMAASRALTSAEATVERQIMRLNKAIEKLTPSECAEYGRLTT